MCQLNLTISKPGAYARIKTVMDYNIDILVAGCNTSCLHCYVDGGRGKIMNLDDFKLCLDKLQGVFEVLKDRISFTLDNELYNHPSCLEILEYVKSHVKENYFHHGSTTGIAFLKEKRKDQIIEVLKENNWLDVSLAIHGPNKIHDAIVFKEGALDSLIEAANLFKDKGLEVWISLIFNKEMVKELDELAKVLKKIRYDYILPVICDYLPLSRLKKYQKIRCDKDDYQKIIPFLDALAIDTRDLKAKVSAFNEENIIKNLDYLMVQKELASKYTAFFHIDQNLDFYLGNTGTRLKYLGNIKMLGTDEILKAITSAKDNYYESSKIHYPDILEAVKNRRLKASSNNYVYPNMIALIMALMDNYEGEGVC